MDLGKEVMQGPAGMVQLVLWYVVSIVKKKNTPISKDKEDWFVVTQKTKEIIKKINKDNVGIFNNKNGFDQVYLLPGLNKMIGD